MLAVYLEETIGVGNFENTPFAPVRGKNLGRIDAHFGESTRIQVTFTARCGLQKTSTDTTHQIQGNAEISTF
jgi:hypothetical protein